MKLTIRTTKSKQIIDITEDIEQALKKMHAVDGLVNIFISHTTAGITTADLDPGTDLDMLDAFAAIIPKLSYRHPHNPAHAPDHILSSLIGTSITLPTLHGVIPLGMWQRIVLCEFDGPRERTVIVTFLSQ